MRTLFLEPPYVFWSLQILGWAALALLVYFSLTALSGPTDIAYVLHPGVQSLIGIFVSWPLRYVFRATWTKPAWSRLTINLLAVLSMAFVWTVLRLLTFVWMTHEEKNFLPEFGAWYFPSILVFLVWAALYHGIQYYLLQQDEHAELVSMSEARKAEELRRSRAESVAQEARLKMLRYQLNPHFLFNTLNAIKSLVHSGRAGSASEMIDQLSEFLRASLTNDPLQMVSVHAEIETLRLYLAIEQTRFVDRLRVEFDIDDDALGLRVPSMILQPLAENAIKHAIAPREEGGTIRVKALTSEGQLQLCIEDDGPGFSASNNDSLGAGVGLNNTRDRLHTLYDDQFDFRLESAEPSGARVVICIPVSATSAATSPSKGKVYA
jgi:sensor histidine kinase YesM